MPNKNRIIIDCNLDTFRHELKTHGVLFDPSEEYRHSPLVFFSKKTGDSVDQWLQRACYLFLAREDDEPIEKLSNLLRGRNIYKQTKHGHYTR